MEKKKTAVKAKKAVESASIQEPIVKEPVVQKTTSVKNTKNDQFHRKIR